MKNTSIQKWVIGILIVLIVASVVSCLGIKSQIRQHNGGNTEVVDSSIFKTISSPLAITCVSVLSADCTKMSDSLTVFIKNNKIEKITDDTKISSEYKIIDGTGQYLIPGLADTHTHLQRNKNDLLLFLANGVTHIADMGSGFDWTLLKWRKEAEEGSLSPKIYVAIGGMSSKKGIIQKIKTWFGDSPKFNTPSQARKAVKKFKNQGYDAIKAYNLSSEVYFAVADEAKIQNIPMIGHLTPELSLKDFYTSSQSQLAHIEEITKATIRDFGGLGYENTDEYLVYLNKNADSIAIKLKQRDVTVSTTVWIIESIYKQNFEIDVFLKNIKLEYQNPGQIEGSKLRKGWLPGNNGYENLEIKDNPEKRKRAKLFWKTYIKAIHIMTKALVNNNVTVITGTDSNGPGVIAGFSLHDELESLNKIGLSNAQILYSATSAPAKWMKSDAGKIEVGLRADLVLLAENPLENISNTKTINGVIINGKFLDRFMLDKILKSVKKANNNSRKVNIDEYIN